VQSSELSVYTPSFRAQKAPMCLRSFSYILYTTNAYLKQYLMTEDDIEELKQIHFKESGEKLSNVEAWEMGTRLIKLFRIIGKKIPENSQESGKST
jgi:hypothetical protein